jgi:hypothetical protein
MAPEVGPEPLTLPASQTSFGSFATDNVELMILVSTRNWELARPAVPQAVQEALSGGPDRSTSAPVGAAARAAFFIDFNRFVFINHGAFGACLREPYNVCQAWRTHCEEQPLRFFDR